MLENFFVQYPVFRYEELFAYLNQQKAYKETTLKALLRYHLQKKHIVRIRRGFYAVVANKKNISTYDSLLIAGRVSETALIAYHSALTFHGIAYSLSNHMYYVSQSPIKTFYFQEVTYQRIAPPQALLPEYVWNETKIIARLGLNQFSVSDLIVATFQVVGVFHYFAFPLLFVVA